MVKLTDKIIHMSDQFFSTLSGENSQLVSNAEKLNWFKNKTVDIKLVISLYMDFIKPETSNKYSKENNRGSSPTLQQ